MVWALVLVVVAFRFANWVILPLTISSLGLL